MPTFLTLPVVSHPSDEGVFAFNRRKSLAAVAAACLGSATALAQVPPKNAKPPVTALPCGDDWPAWVQFRSLFVLADGRVVDPDTPRAQTVSEAQAYGLFFALAANDRPSFEKILKWTENNLANGDLTAQLPAWIWGRRDDGAWGIVDGNSATDADLWIIYALGEAGRLWRDKRFTALASVIADRLLRECVAELPGLGLTLLPGPKGFQLSAGRWRLNPSYFPMHLMRWMAKQYPNPAWGKLAVTARTIILGSAPKGFSPDWVIYQANKGFELDLQGAERGEGAYNAIRVYLWAGLMATGDPTARQLVKAFTPMVKFVAKAGHPPESIDILTGQGLKPSPSGFSSAVLPLLEASGDKTTLQAQLNRLQAKPIRTKAYYEQALNLFGMGWHEAYYRFSADGKLLPKWRVACDRQ